MVNSDPKRHRLRDGRQISNDICCLQSYFDLRPVLVSEGKTMDSRHERTNQRIEQYSRNYFKNLFTLFLKNDFVFHDKLLTDLKFERNWPNCLIQFESLKHGEWLEEPNSLRCVTIEHSMFWLVDVFIVPTRTEKWFFNKSTASLKSTLVEFTMIRSISKTQHTKKISNQ